MGKDKGGKGGGGRGREKRERHPLFVENGLNL